MPIYNNKDFTKLMRPLPNSVNRDICDIPFIEIDNIDISDLNNGKWLISLNNLSHKDGLANKKIVQSFSYDDVLYREYNNPYRFLQKIANYYVVTTFDFSMDSSMDFPLILYATYSNRWIGAFCQSHGKKVIPTIGWVGNKYYDICFAGLRNGGVFIISTLGTNNEISHKDFIDGYYEMRNRFPLSRIICVGDKVQGMDSDICYIKYENSFGYWNRLSPYWQPKMFNWDGSINKKIVSIGGC